VFLWGGFENVFYMLSRVSMYQPHANEAFAAAFHDGFATLIFRKNVGNLEKNKVIT